MRQAATRCWRRRLAYRPAPTLDQRFDRGPQTGGPGDTVEIGAGPMPPTRSIVSATASSALSVTRASSCWGEEHRRPQLERWLAAPSTRFPRSSVDGDGARARRRFGRESRTRRVEAGPTGGRARSQQSVRDTQAVVAPPKRKGRRNCSRRPFLNLGLRRLKPPSSPARLSPGR